MDLDVDIIQVSKSNETLAKKLLKQKFLRLYTHSL